ncbi:hypothetical protein [Rufibacter soli]
MLHKYLSYSSEDFIEDSFFWGWVLGEEQESNAFWKEFIQTNPHKAVAIGEARESILQLNAEKNRLSKERVASIWSRIQESKNQTAYLETAHP